MNRILVVLIACLCHAATAGATFDGWRVHPIRSQYEYEHGQTGGEGMQHFTGISTRSSANPAVVYVSIDQGGSIWKTSDSGTTWRATLCKGLHGSSGRSVEHDPVDVNIVYTIRSHHYDLSNNQVDSGLYRSTDGGENWTQVVSSGVAGATGGEHMIKHLIAYAPSSAGTHRAERWYAILYNPADNANNTYQAVNGQLKFFRSLDGGVSWSQASTLLYNRAFRMQVHPTIQDTVFVTTNDGLLKSADGGVNWTKIYPLPGAGNSYVTGLSVDTQSPNTIWIVGNYAIYKTINGGSSWSSIDPTYSNGWDVRVHPADSNKVYRVTKELGSGSSTIQFSNNAGSTWTTSLINPAPGLERESGWSIRLQGGFCNGFAPHPTDTKEAIIGAQARFWKTTDSWAILDASSTMYTGYAASMPYKGFVFDSYSPNRMALMMWDGTCILTTNGGNWWEHRKTGLSALAGTYFPSGQVLGVQAAFKPGGGNHIVGTFGSPYFGRPAYSTNLGTTWIQPTTPPAQDWKMNGIIEFHQQNNSIVYTDEHKSTDSGVNWTAFSGGGWPSAEASLINVCRSDSNKLLAFHIDSPYNMRRLYRSTDGGTTWAQYGPDRDGSTYMGERYGFPIIDVAQQGCATVYAGDSASGDAIRYTGSGSWTSLGVYSLLTSELNGRDGKIRSIAVDPRYDNIIYATFSRPGNSRIFRSVNSGATWTNISYNLPLQSTSSISISPLTGEVVMNGGNGTWVMPPPAGYESTTYGTPLYDKSILVASCFDGLQNGTETGVDTGGSCSASTTLPDFGITLGPGGLSIESGGSLTINWQQ